MNTMPRQWPILSFRLPHWPPGVLACNYRNPYKNKPSLEPEPFVDDTEVNRGHCMYYGHTCDLGLVWTMWMCISLYTTGPLKVDAAFRRLSAHIITHCSNVGMKKQLHISRSYFLSSGEWHKAMRYIFDVGFS